MLRRTLGILCFVSSILIITYCSNKTDNVAISLDGTKILFDHKGQGKPAIVFIHGWGGTKNDFYNQVDYFSPSYQTISIDLAGFGKSGNNRKIWTMNNFAADVIAVMDHLEIKEAVLVGQSMGGIVILEVAKKIPDRIIGVVPLDIIVNVEATRTEEQIENGVKNWMDWATNPTYEKMKSILSENTDSLLIEKVVTDMKNHSKVGWEESIRETLQYLSSPNVLANLLSEIKVPIHCVNKAHTKTNLDVARKYNPNITASSIKNVGHFFLWDAPDEFNKLLENAIEDFKSEEEK